MNFAKEPNMKKLIAALFVALAASGCTASVKSAKDFRPINPSLYDLIQPYKVTDPAQMPYTYQAANPAGAAAGTFATACRPRGRRIRFTTARTPQSSSQSPRTTAKTTRTAGFRRGVKIMPPRFRPHAAAWS